MAIYERGRKSDGVISMEGGMDGGLSPSLIKKNQCAYAENTTFRGGYAKTRPAFRNVPLDGGADATAMLAAKFQGAGHYDESGYQHIIVVAGGNVYKVSPPASGEVWTVTDITGTAILSRPEWIGTTGNVYGILKHAVTRLLEALRARLTTSTITCKPHSISTLVGP